MMNMHGMVRIAKDSLFCGLAAGALACAAQAQEISPAEKMLFMSNHMRSLAAPLALHYAYVRRDKTGPGFSDEVVLQVTGRNPDGSAAVSSRFLSGDRQVSLPPLNDAQGNPALLGFLERDIGEMKRLTGGSASYFRKRIRIALAEAASVEDVALTYEGRRVAGRKVAIQPYLHDPMQDKMPKYLAKRYVFLLSDDVPGTVVQVKSTVPEGEGRDAALMEETMTLAGAQDSS